MSLRSKGLIAIGIPLLLQLAVIMSFHHLLSRAVQRSQNEFRAKEVVGHINWLSTLGTVAALSADGYAVTGDASLLDTYQSASSQLNQELSSTEELFKNAANPEAQRLIEDGRKLQHHLDDVLKMKSEGRSEAEIKAAVTSREAKNLWNDLQVTRSAILKREQIRRPRTEWDMPQTFKVMDALLLAWVVVTVIIAIALMYFFSRNIIRRLNIMTENTSRLPQQMPLLEPVSGRDELALLDRSFHAMANELKRLEKMKREFVQLISHDLRTPLTSIQAFLTLLGEGHFGEMPEKVTRRARMADSDASRLISLISNLLDIERMESGKMEVVAAEVRVQQVIDRAVHSVVALTERNKIAVKAPALGEMRMTADEDLIIQVLVNLLSNAIKFSAKESDISIDVVEIEKERCGGGSGERRSFLKFSVSDRGRGIPADRIDMIFDRFKQVEVADAREKGGSGLGLAISKAIVEAHGGAIGVTSTEGSGSTFWFTIPQ